MQLQASLQQFYLCSNNYTRQFCELHINYTGQFYLCSNNLTRQFVSFMFILYHINYTSSFFVKKTTLSVRKTITYRILKTLTVFTTILLQSVIKFTLSNVKISLPKVKLLRADHLFDEIPRRQLLQNSKGMLDPLQRLQPQISNKYIEPFESQFKHEIIVPTPKHPNLNHRLPSSFCLVKEAYIIYYILYIVQKKKKEAYIIFATGIEF